METTKVPLAQIVRGDNDRQRFSREGLEDLANSIQEHGLAQPITVRPIATRCPECGESTPLDAAPVCGHAQKNPEPVFEIVAGERRYRAHRILSEERGIERFQTIDAHVRELSDEAASAIMLAENVGREDLDEIEEAMAYQKRIDQFGWTVKETAKRAGVTTVRVKFRLKLLDLRPDIQKLVSDGQLTVGYARILTETELDTNRQLIALKRLRDNPHPTQAWFRKECNQLREEQVQEPLFDASIFTVQTPEDGEDAFQDPPLPTTTEPPRRGQSLREIIAAQIDFWTQAAEAWDELGKPFKRQECQAAAHALKAAIA